MMMLQSFSRISRRSCQVSVVARASHTQRHVPLASTLITCRFNSSQSTPAVPEEVLATKSEGVGQLAIHAVDLVRDNLLDLHAYLDLPWLWVIPIAAACVRLTLFLPITRPARQALQRRLALTPILDAGKKWTLDKCRTAHVQENASRRDNGQAPLPVKQIQRDYARALKEKRKALERRYRAGILNVMLKPAVVQTSVFVLVGSAIRDLGGMKRNILLSFFASDQTGDESVISHLEPSMLTEGPSWAADLTVADPTGLLPASVVVIMTTATILSARAQRIDGRDSTPTAAINSLSLIVVLGMAPFIWGAPAGLLYYWACSSGMAVVVNQYLDWRHPLTRVAACKRPLTSTLLVPHKFT